MKFDFGFKVCVSFEMVILAKKGGRGVELAL